MVYYSGQATNYQDLLNALTNTCVANGWNWAGNILSKDNLCLELIITATGIVATGGTHIQNNALQGRSPIQVRMGSPSTVINLPIFPVFYHVFIFENEVYLVAKFNVNSFYHLCFGKSSLQLDQAGLWVSATSTITPSSAQNGGVSISNTGSGSTGATSVGPFWRDGTGQLTYHNSVISHGIDGEIWSPSTTKAACATLQQSPLQNRQPSAWSGDSYLQPINIILDRASSKKSLICAIKNARYIRIDNIEPEQILDFGYEKWMVFPFYKKNILSRDGGSNVDHTGTLGWAIRYAGS